MNAPAADPKLPHEPEIEVLARLARMALLGIRFALWTAGAVAIGYSVCMVLSPAAAAPPDYDTATPAAPGVLEPRTTYLVWLCAGLPLVARAQWLFSRRWWLALAVGAVAWFAPSLADADHDYAWGIRMFASLVAFVTLVVWRVLWSLTQTGEPHS